MPSFISWDIDFKQTTIKNSLIANGTELLTETISNHEKQVTEIGVEVVNGSTVNAGVRVYLVRNVNGVNESSQDLPMGFELAANANVASRKSITIDALHMSEFKVLIENNSGSDVSATVVYKQAVYETI